MSSTVAMDELSVGMYIHLDGGWLSHPFPLSSFRISSPEQIAVLRGLGLSRVRWVPEKSDPPTLAATAGEVPDGPGLAAVAGTAPAAEERAAHHRRWQLIAQREALLRCERQYGEAAQTLHEAGEALAMRPCVPSSRTAAPVSACTSCAPRSTAASTCAWTTPCARPW